MALMPAAIIGQLRCIDQLGAGKVAGRVVLKN
jgi:hypothetical protein